MTGPVIALSGGVGGAKLALGLHKILDLKELLIVANSGDDFEHQGFYISPDIDTLLYTLGGLSNTETGWGRAKETWSFMDVLKKENPAQSWFQLGDKDLETHRFRSGELASGRTLSEVTSDLAGRYKLGAQIIPMSDQPVRTFVEVEMESEIHWLPFQEYFVKHQCRPRICSIEYRGLADARVSPNLESALALCQPRAIILCPSNPFLSIDPILAVPGMVELLKRDGAPVVAVSPVIGGKALKGPTAKIMEELGMPVTVTAIADHYRGIVDGLVIDEVDRGEAVQLESAGIRTFITNTIMTSLQDRIQLAQDVLAFAASLE